VVGPDDEREETEHEYGVNHRLVTPKRLAGVGGNDFLINGWSVAIKTTGYWKSPDLKEFINPKHRSHVYVLVAVDLSKARGRLVGYISGKRFFEAPTEQYRGLGERHVARESDLTKDWGLLWDYLNNNQPLPLRLNSK
jgi:hypothetical protein